MDVSIINGKIIVNNCKNYKIFLNGYPVNFDYITPTTRKVTVICYDDREVYEAILDKITIAIPGVYKGNYKTFIEELEGPVP